jgi:hypothetical protein
MAADFRRQLSVPRFGLGCRHNFHAIYDQYLFNVAQTSKSAVSRVSKPAGGKSAQPTWKSAAQQVWKPALR